MAIQHILIPTDFSEYADYALDYALELTQKLQARLTLLHVLYLSPLTVGEVPPSVFNQILQDMQNWAQQQMQETLERVKQTGIYSESAIVEGAPFQMIINTAKDKGVDLIVMGTHGRTGLTHVLIGSVAEKVVRLAPCPVLVTRGTTKASDA